ncbi:uncharacterized protein LOC131995249 [Stomoxys calcitrans]|uniref:uncharacterized protein LOC131995249 n=1 Tax=Stomoxys calcitrans TaxID=35570 RepID=UPI0027E3A225|nr:uncharacterized protein LOC131995249 [Stomoxys calcitrans]
MSRNLVSREKTFNQLYAAIKSKLQQDGGLEEVHCMVQTQIMAMMKGKYGKPTWMHSEDCNGDARMALLHQLIMEYFQWHGFHYSAQMFAQESACENAKPLRKCFEAILGGFEDKSVPILLQMVAERMVQHCPTHCQDNAKDGENNCQ